MNARTQERIEQAQHEKAKVIDYTAMAEGTTFGKSTVERCPKCWRMGLHRDHTDNRGRRIESYDHVEVEKYLVAGWNWPTYEVVDSCYIPHKPRWKVCGYVLKQNGKRRYLPDHFGERKPTAEAHLKKQKRWAQRQGLRVKGRLVDGVYTLLDSAGEEVGQLWLERFNR